MRKYKASRLLIFSLLAIAMVVLTVALKGQTQNKSTSATNEEATSLQEGALTEKQREHSKLFKGEYESRRGKKIKDLLASRPGELTIWLPNETGFQLVDSPPPSIYETINNMVCDADAVVIGTVKSKSAQLTEDGEFIFTDYELVVEEILKDNATVPLSLGNNITVTRIGGTIELNGKPAKAEDPRFKPLAANKRYLLFLKYIPATGAYKAYSSKGSFQLLDNKLFKLTQEPLRNDFESGSDATSIINQIRAAAYKGVEKKGGTQ